MKDPKRNAKRSALAAGCSEKSARVMGPRWKKLPEIKAALEGKPGKATGPKKATAEKATKEEKATEEKATEKATSRPLVGVCQLPGWEEKPAEKLPALGRPKAYDRDIAEEVCDRLATSDMSLAKICDAEERFPAVRTVYAWLGDYPEFSQLYARAREAQADYLADQVLEIADDGSADLIYLDDGKGGGKTVVDKEHIARSRLRAEMRLKLMEKLAPKKYGGKGIGDETPSRPRMNQDQTEARIRELWTKMGGIGGEPEQSGT